MSESSAVPAVSRSAISVREAATALGLSRSTVYALISQGELRARRIGRRIVIPIGAVDELLGEGIVALPRDVGSLTDNS